MQDPFMDDHLTIKGSKDERDPNFCKNLLEDVNSLVYHRQRFTVDHSPVQIFIPRKELMLKMIRACVGVKMESKLWFNVQNTEYNKIEEFD